VRKTVVKKRKLLSSEGVLRIVRAIQAAPTTEPLTWSDIQEIASEHAGGGYVWTRQALERHTDIKGAYLAHDVERRKRTRKGKRLLALRTKLTCCARP
jgi:glucokinase